MRPPSLARSSLLSRRALGFVFASRLLSSSASTLGELPPLAPTKRRLYLCRHGETDWNTQDRIQGSTDNALNAVGRTQVRALAESLQDVPFGLVASSNLQRARETADAVAEFHPAATRRADAFFAEMNFGELEGRTLSEIRPTVYNPTIARWADGDVDAAWPGGESPSAVAERGIAGLREIGLIGGEIADNLPGGKFSRCPKNVLIAAHGRFNKILLAALRGDLTKSSEIEQGNTCVNVVDFAADGSCEVVALNLQGHLDALLAASK